MEKIKLDCAIAGSVPVGINQQLTLDYVIEVIKSKGYQKDVEEGLISRASKRPTGSYESFLKKIYTYINEIGNHEQNSQEKNN
jgi:hypothetical protein